MEIDRLEIIVEAEMKKASGEMDRLISKLKQVGSAMSEVTGLKSNGSRSISSNIKSATNTLSGYTKSTSTAIMGTRSLTAQLGRLALAFYSVRRAVNFMGNSMKKSMDYVETVNLFQTSIKKVGMETASKLGMDWGSTTAESFAKGFIREAENFNDFIVDRLTLDPDLMKNYQAVFAQMTNSMGLSAMSSMAISESFTMLGNDIASLWNIDTDKAMKKLQSGLAGQIRPLRELGIDISKTSLEMYALNHGIEDSVEKMSQAAKVQLRWLAIMEQAQVSFGDMAKTIESPANQLRILSQQWTNLSRSVGNVFLPAISKALPYINATVIALRNMIDVLATAMGYEVPDYSGSNIYRDITGDIEGMEDAADGATEANEKLKKSIMGFDELNILSDKMSSALKGLGPGAGYQELDDAINRKTISYMEKWNEEMAKMSNKAKELAEVIQPRLEKFVEFMDKISPILKGIGTAFVTYKVINWFIDLATWLGALALTPAGAVALAIGGIAAIYYAVKEYNEKLIKEDLARRFGDIALSMEEIRDIAERLTSSEYTAKIDIFITENAKLDQIEKNIKKDIETLNKLNWKVKIGLALTEGEIAQYKAAIESFIANSEAYIEQQHYVTTLAIEAVIQDANFKAEISQLVDKYFDGSKGEMERLGKSLRSTMDEALADGILDVEEQKVINNLMKEISAIQERIANAEFVAKLQTITLEGDLNADSYKKLFKEIQEQIDQRSKGAEEATIQMLTVVNAQYQIDMKNATTAEQRQKIKDDYNRAVRGIQNDLNLTKILISDLGMSFAYGKILEKWQPELSKFGVATNNAVQTAIQSVLDEGMMGVDPEWGMRLFLTRTIDTFNAEVKNSGMTKAARTALEQMLAELIPTAEDNKKIADEYLKTGQAIPDALSLQLTSEANLRALAGDIDGIYFMMGQQMAESPEILTMLKNGEITAEDLDKSIIRGLKNMIPDIKLQGEQVVFDLDKAIQRSSSDSAKNSIPKSAQEIISSLNNTFKNDTSAKSSVSTWLQSIYDTLKNWTPPRLQMPSIDMGSVSLPGQHKGPIATFAKGGFVTPKKFATGGVPDFGQLFIAREAGPELVGNLGGRSNAVANNYQIEKGIEEASYRGYVRAMAATGGSGRSQSSGDIYLVTEDYEVLARAVNRGFESLDGRYNAVKFV